MAVDAAFEHCILSGSIVVFLMVCEAGMMEQGRFLSGTGCPTPHASQEHETGQVPSWHSGRFRSRPGG